jgi:hypothetical protein
MRFAVRIGERPVSLGGLFYFSEGSFDQFVSFYRERLRSHGLASRIPLGIVGG